MNAYKINTTAYSEEDFFLITDLTGEEIGDVIYPIVFAEREQDIDYTNEEIVKELKKKYPKRSIRAYEQFIELSF
jgi:uncharacterized protein YxjI